MSSVTNGENLKPTCVLISDVHYSVQTLPLADNAMRQAIAKANQLRIPLVIAGDLHDTKANMRAECVNAMLKTFSLCQTAVYILRGNHDQINEKSEEHALNFLSERAIIVDEPMDMPLTGCHGIPYHHEPERLKEHLRTLHPGGTLIMHQGVSDAHSGEYIQDRSALRKEDFADFRVISGHYHTRQTIKCGRPKRNAVGLFSYIGNPYTLNFAEASDPPKGFQILQSDGTLRFIPTNLRKHVIIDFNVKAPSSLTDLDITKEDLVWVKVRGPKELLSPLNRQAVASLLQIEQDFRLEFIPDTDIRSSADNKVSTQFEILDSLIDAQDISSERKCRLKFLWRTACA